MPIAAEHRHTAHEAVRILFDPKNEIDWIHGPINPGRPRAFDPKVDLEASLHEVRRAMQRLFDAGQDAIEKADGACSAITERVVRPHPQGVWVTPQSEYEQEEAAVTVIGAIGLTQAMQELIDAPEVCFQWVEGADGGGVQTGAALIPRGRPARQISGDEWLAALTR